MNAKRIASTIVVLLLAGAWLYARSRPRLPPSHGAAAAAERGERKTGQSRRKADHPKRRAPRSTAPGEIWVRGPRGRENIAPTLARIERGERHRHKRDGSTFFNRERRLPIRARGYYREYVHPTPGKRGAGAQRIVVGRSGETYYTPDHYRTFEQVAVRTRQRPRR